MASRNWHKERKHIQNGKHMSNPNELIFTNNFDGIKFDCISVSTLFVAVLLFIEQLSSVSILDER